MGVGGLVTGDWQRSARTNSVRSNVVGEEEDEVDAPILGGRKDTDVSMR